MAKILMVDDEELFCKTAGIFLSRAGHEVHTAGTSREAIDWGSHFRPEVLLTDRMLENSVHGLDITRALQLVTHRSSAQGLPPAPTERSDERSRQAAGRAGDRAPDRESLPRAGAG